ncbi:recombinase RecF, partial [Sulfurovum sp. bin170]|nr:recombinase RecF [Sulfurovum sp. bin170]
MYLNKFNKKFYIKEFFFDKEFTEDGKVEFIVNVKIDFMNNDLNTYHRFLNEAKLSALAIAIHFAIIRNVSDKLENNSLKLLILDDLFISLDMSNRLSLITLLKEYFSDFQIFFFTHDKALFEIFKDKMSWRAYEIYVDESDEGYEIPFLKKSNTLLEQAKLQKYKKNYDCSANLLRQYTEKLLCKFLPTDRLVNRNCKQLDLNGLLQNGVRFENEKDDTNQNIIAVLEELKTYRSIVLNPASHYHDINVYRRELEDIILSLNKLEYEL